MTDLHIHPRDHRIVAVKALGVGAALAIGALALLGVGAWRWLS
jgi:hypothetical protein